MTGRQCQYQCCCETKHEEGDGEDEGEICPAVRRSLNSLQKQVAVTDCLLKTNASCVNKK
jgi:hypothetical protein